MRTTVTLDQELIKELRALTKSRTKAESVRIAVQDYIRRQKIEKLISLFGKIDIDEDAIYALEEAELAEDPWNDARDD